MREGAIWTTRNTVLALGLVSALALAFAIGSQFVFGYAPCALCMVQRWWHAAVVGAAALMLALRRKPRLFLTLQTAAVLICFGYSLFHAGVEKHWWEGTQVCVGQTGATTTQGLLNQILTAPVVRCDEVRWTFLGLSMAAWDAVLTFLMAAFATLTSVRKT